MVHNMITDPKLRQIYASELYQARTLRSVYSRAEWYAFRLGLESGFWAMQKALNNDSE